jgi:catechol 2,3-dioxygenase-like lactoylglutathione lyase family enzyme
MLTQGLDMVLIMVTDTSRSVAWYRDVLEMTVRMHHGDFALLDAAGTTVALHGGAEPAAATGNQGTLAVFRVADYAAAKATLEDRGCRFTFENTQGSSTFGTFLDPDGTPIQIIQRG